MSPEHFLFESCRVAIATALAVAVDCYNCTTPTALHVGEDEVEEVYETLARGNNVRGAFHQLVKVVSVASLQTNHVYTTEIHWLLQQSHQLVQAS